MHILVLRRVEESLRFQRRSHTVNFRMDIEQRDIHFDWYYQNDIREKREPRRYGIDVSYLSLQFPVFRWKFAQPMDRK